MNATQLTKFQQGKAFAESIVKGTSESFNAFVPSKAKNRTLEIASRIAHITPNDLTDANGHEDGVKVAAILSIILDLNTAYKSASVKTVKEDNAEDKKYRVQWEKLVMRYGEIRAREIIAERVSRINTILDVASRE